jgi:hypothetical protein
MILKKLIICSLIITSLFLIGCGNTPKVNLDTFASCLNDNGAVMYGASWCGHCSEQKELFGESFEKVNYVECTLQQEKCQNDGIQGYPTWKFADDSIAMGKQEFSTLAERAGCLLN